MSTENINNELKTKIVVCPNINQNLIGNITEILDNKTTMVLKITSEMICDGEGLAHSSFIYLSAMYLAQATINKENTYPISSRVNYYSPSKLGDEIILVATAKFDNSRKREVEIIGTIREVKIFEATFQILITDEHILKIQNSELAKYQSRK